MATNNPRTVSPDTSEETLRYQTVDGAVLSFKNGPGAYRVNRDQSFVLATAASVEAIRCALDYNFPLRMMRALDVCCGAGPAALALKRLDVGYVEASDVADAAVRRCQAHASLNNIKLERIVRRDLLGDSVDASGKFHIIASNPPCARSSIVDSRWPDELQRAVDGGESGAEVIVRLIRTAKDHLFQGGRLVVAVPSTVCVADTVKALRECFDSAWGVAACSPTASRYCRVDDPIAKLMLEQRRSGSAFVWQASDGWLWRLTWVLAATHGRPGASAAGLSFAPYGMANLDDDYWRAVEERGLSRLDLFEPARAAR